MRLDMSNVERDKQKSLLRRAVAALA